MQKVKNPLVVTSILLCALLAIFGFSYLIDNSSNEVAIENDLIAKGGQRGHHGGHRGHRSRHGGHHRHHAHSRHDRHTHHGHHRQYRRDHRGNRWNHDHANHWWHHRNHPGWSHNHGHHPWHNAYWYGAAALGGAALGSAATTTWGNYPGYYYDPSFYYQSNGTPSIEYEYDTTPAASTVPSSTTNVIVQPAS